MRRIPSHTRTTIVLALDCAGLISASGRLWPSSLAEVLAENGRPEAERRAGAAIQKPVSSRLPGEAAAALAPPPFMRHRHRGMQFKGGSAARFVARVQPADYFRQRRLS